MEFSTSFFTIARVMLEIALMVCIGAIFGRHAKNSAAVQSLGQLVVNVCMPALIIYYFLAQTADLSLRDLLLYPALGVIVCLSGGLLGWGLSILPGRAANRALFVSLLAFQNCGYLPLVLVAGAFAAEKAQLLTVQILLFIQGFNIVFWGVGVQLVRRQRLRGILWKHIMNPPLAALLICVVLLLSGMTALVPRSLIRVARLIGECTMPMALLVLGAVLAECWRGLTQTFSQIWLPVFTKLIVFPALMLWIVNSSGISPRIGLLLVLQAAMPSAINLSVVSAADNSHCSPLSHGVLLSHLGSILTAPFFLAAYHAQGW